MAMWAPLKLFHQRSRSYSSFWHDSSRGAHAAWLVGLTLLLGIAALVVWATGGTAFSYTHAMLVPIILAAARYRVLGGVVSGVLAGIVIGPWMPLDVAQGFLQTSSNWLTRLLFYVGLGALSGLLFHQLATAAKQREEGLRVTSAGMLNHAALLADLSAILIVPQRRANVALVLVQVADFVEILSSIGAEAEGALLEAIGRNIQKSVGAQMQLYHYGSTELVVVLRIKSQAELDHALERIIVAGEEPVNMLGIPIRAQLVLGACRFNETARRPQEMIRRVRVAAFEALEQQQPFRYYSEELERDTAEGLRLVAQVRRALAAREFELHLQPKIRLRDGAVYGCEGLLRWRDKKAGLIAPGLFMPKVERTTLIGPVTRFVSLEAVEYIVSQQIGPISINFTVGNIFDEKLLEWLLTLIKEQKVPPQSLEIEITEGALIHDAHKAINVMNQLKEAGVPVLLDDFGTGYSSFHHLRHLPISGLKIDRAFVQGLDVDPRARRLMTCLIEVAHALDLKVTAEGVETRGQAEQLRRLGCDYAQGYFYGRAMPAHEYQQWVVQQQGLQHKLR